MSQFYKHLLGFLDDESAVQHYLVSLPQQDVASLVMYLAERQRVRDAAARSYTQRKMQDLGAAPSWVRAKADPEAYQKRLEYNRAYRRRKRDQARGVVDATNARNTEHKN